jgi:hypothetical protein
LVFCGNKNLATLVSSRSDFELTYSPACRSKAAAAGLQGDQIWSNFRMFWPIDYDGQHCKIPVTSPKKLICI